MSHDNVFWSVVEIARINHRLDVLEETLSNVSIKKDAKKMLDIVTEMRALKQQKNSLTNHHLHL